MHVGVIDEARSRELRRSVLRPTFAPGDPLPGDDLDNGVHIGATDGDGTVLGTCFIYPEACPWHPEATAWRLRSMATQPQLRSTGVGGAVLAQAIEYASAAGAEVLWCTARLPAARFYERHGFVTHGDVYEDGETAVPHVKMARELRERPTSSEG